MIKPGFNTKLGRTFSASIELCPVFPCPFGGSDCLGIIENEAGTIEVIDLEANQLTEFEESGVLTYPNPFNHTINVDFQLLQDQDVELSIITISGKEISRKTIKV